MDIHTLRYYIYGMLRTTVKAYSQPRVRLTTKASRHCLDWQAGMGLILQQIKRYNYFRLLKRLFVHPSFSISCSPLLSRLLELFLSPGMASGIEIPGEAALGGTQEEDGYVGSCDTVDCDALLERMHAQGETTHTDNV